jgi:hypothetical protein
MKVKSLLLYYFLLDRKCLKVYSFESHLYLLLVIRVKFKSELLHR